MKFKAIVTDKLDGRKTIIESEYEKKSDFIRDIRSNGYRVDDRKVKESEVFDFIMTNTDCEKLDWQVINRRMTREEISEAKQKYLDKRLANLEKSLDK